jgi:hypothetical protein
VLLACCPVVLAVSAVVPERSLAADMESRQAQYSVQHLGVAFLPGCPAIVEVTCQNPTSEPMRVYDLGRLSFWWFRVTWEDRNGTVIPVDYREVLRDAIVDEDTDEPRTVVLAPRQSTAWYLSIPSHPFCPVSSLTLTISNYDRLDVLPPGGVRLETPLERHEGDFPSWDLWQERWLFQAAILGRDGSAMSELRKRGVLPKLERWARQGDQFASLLLLADALQQGRRVDKYWRQLADAPQELGLVRDHMLLVRLRQNRTILSEDDRNLLRFLCRRENPLSIELKALLGDDGMAGRDDPQAPGRRTFWKSSYVELSLLVVLLALPVLILMRRFRLRRARRHSGSSSDGGT